MTGIKVMALVAASAIATFCSSVWSFDTVKLTESFVPSTAPE